MGCTGKQPATTRGNTGGRKTAKEERWGKMKKFAAIAVAAMAAGCIGLAGCSGEVESTQPQEAEPAASSEQTLIS